ncbi:hypothetical protein [Streptomyces mirabilis]|uniref:hypothetical protein n=1 Tax=Streptomyces mirabilis TaxID=68239 RepID=UPI0036DA2EA4
MSQPARSDLPLEVDTTLDAAGEYVSPWIDSADMYSVAAWYSPGTPGVVIESSLDASSVLIADSWSNGSEKPVHTRFWRVSVTGGTANAVFRLSARVVG